MAKKKAIITVDSVAGGLGPYLYSLNDAPYVDWPVFADLPAGVYHLNIQDVEGCELDTTLTIDEPSAIYLGMGGDTLIQLGETVDLDPQILSGPFTFQWSDNPFLACDTCLTQTVPPLKTSTFALTITDENGCVAQDRRTIYVEEGDLVYIPSAFSPDGNGTNDVFEIFPSSGVARVKSFYIYDRWGEVVHERHNFLPGDPGNGWDGYFRGKALNPAVFVYHAELILLNGSSRLFKGSITLIR